MRKNVLFFILRRGLIVSLLFGLFLTCSGCSGRKDTHVSIDSPSGELDSYDSDSVNHEAIRDITAEGMAWADSILQKMTLEERVGQLFLPAMYASSDPVSMKRLRRYAADLHIGGVVLLKGTVESVGRIAQVLDSASVAPPFMAIDAEWGLGMRLSDTPVFPRNGRINGTADQNLLYEYGSEVARECRLAGINMVLGPVADVSGAGGIMGVRSFGGDPERVAEMTVAYSRGLEDGNVLSVAKHFPGHGSPAQNSHKDLAVISSSAEELDRVDLLPFKAYTGAGLSGIMAGHLAVPAVDSLMVPASFSRPILTGLLRERLGFKGLILTDALNMGGATGYNASDALRAGADIVLAPADTEKEVRGVIKDVNDGRIPLSLINDRCGRILLYKYLIKRKIPGRTPGLQELETAMTDSLRRALSGQAVQRNS